MTTLIVAAGGGGDAVGAILARRFIDPSGGPLLIASCAWERLRIDPEPGPRGRADFRNLATLDGVECEIRPYTDTKPAGRSMLPRLSETHGLRLFLLDLGDGAEGLTAQLDHLIQALGVNRVVVLDVGGDAVAAGTEPRLRSPLADSLAVAAAARCIASAHVVVIGPGADDELTTDEVETRATALGGQHLGTVSRIDAEAVRQILDWHPTEATAAVAASAAGVRGAVETRQGGAVPLSAATAQAWAFPLKNPAPWPLASALASSNSIQDAAGRLTAMHIPSELELEHKMASRRGHAAQHPIDHQIVLATFNRGPRGLDTYITSRRLLEVAQCPRSLEKQYLSEMRAHLEFDWGLWNTTRK